MNTKNDIFQQWPTTINLVFTENYHLRKVIKPQGTASWSTPLYQFGLIVSGILIGAVEKF